MVAFAVAFFTVSYGVRGFVFADLFQSPVLILASIIVLVGGCLSIVSLAAPSGDANPASVPPLASRLMREFLTPRLTLAECVTFAGSTLFLNSFLVLVTPAHWLRVWIFGERETQFQVSAILGTGTFWLLFIVVGVAASLMYTAHNDFAALAGGNTVVIGLLEAANGVSALVVVAFWIAGVAALFSTADAQLYSLLLLRAYRVRTNSIDNSLRAMVPWTTTAIVSAGFAATYFAVRYAGLNLDKLILVALPACLVLVPSFVAVAKGRSPSLSLIIVSIVLYTACAVAGIVSSDADYLATVAAPLLPLVLAVLVWTWPSRDRRPAEFGVTSEAEHG
jgi:hypothetical protein